MRLRRRQLIGPASVTIHLFVWWLLAIAPNFVRLAVSLAECVLNSLHFSLLGVDFCVSVVDENHKLMAIYICVALSKSAESVSYRLPCDM